MDIQILLFLQNFRNGAGSFLTTPMVLFTDIAAYGSPICAIIIYWAVSRSFGYWLMANVASGFFVNNVIKLAACIYRPWIANHTAGESAEKRHRIFLSQRAYAGSVFFFRCLCGPLGW